MVIVSSTSFLVRSALVEHPLLVRRFHLIHDVTWEESARVILDYSSIHQSDRFSSTTTSASSTVSSSSAATVSSTAAAAVSSTTTSSSMVYLVDVALRSSSGCNVGRELVVHFVPESGKSLFVRYRARYHGHLHFD